VKSIVLITLVVTLGGALAACNFNPAMSHIIGENESRCNAGDGIGCLHLAMLYEKGAMGVQPDKKRAAEYYKKACDAHEDAGCLFLAQLQKGG